MNKKMMTYFAVLVLVLPISLWPADGAGEGQMGNVDYGMFSSFFSQREGV